MRNTVVLPEYLSSRYENWLEVYLNCRHSLPDNYPQDKVFMMSELDWDVPVNMVQEFTLNQLKLKAFDFLINSLPDNFDVYYEIYSLGRMSVHPLSEDARKGTETLMDIAHTFRRHKINNL